MNKTKSSKHYESGDLCRFIESLKFRPETYRTILLDAFDNKSTETTKVRKKISKFVKQGLIAGGLLEGEAGTKIFYSLEKKYFIFILRTQEGFFYYYCSDVDENCKEEGCIVLYNAFILREWDWEYLGNIAVKKESIHRWW